MFKFPKILKTGLGSPKELPTTYPSAIATATAPSESMSKKKKSRLPTVDTRSRPSSPSPPTDHSPTLVPPTALITPAVATASAASADTPRIQDNPFFSLSDTGSMGPKDKEDPTAPEGADDDDPSEDPRRRFTP